MKVSVKGVAFFVSIYLLSITNTLGQGDIPKLSMSYASHVQLALGSWRDVKNNNALSKFTSGDGVFDVKDISKIRDKRPRFFKHLEKIRYNDLAENRLKDYTRILNDQAIYYHAMGQHHLADVLLIKVLKINGQHYGKTSEPYLATLHNLAILRKDQGRFDAAEDILKYVLRYYLQVNGEASHQYIIALNNMAMLNGGLGRTKLAISQLKQARELELSHSFPNQSLDRERMSVNRALLAMDQEDEQLAEKLLLEVKSRLEAKGFEDHPDYNDVIILLGSVYLSNNTSSLLLPLLDDAIEKVNKKYGNAHPYYANVLELQAERNLSTGEYQLAKEQFQTIVSIRKDALGDRHPQYLNALASLAITEHYSGNSSVALLHFQEVLETYLYLAQLFFPTMSETEQANFWATFQPNIGLFHEFAMQNKSVPDVVTLALNIQLSTKGMLLNSSRKVKQGILNSGDAEQVYKFQQWQTGKEELAGYYRLDKEQLSDLNIDLSLVENNLNDLEKELVRESQAISSLSFSVADWHSVANNLKENEAAVEIVRFGGRYGKFKGKPFYFALVVKHSGSPSIVELGDGTNLEGKYYKYYKNAIKNKVEDNISYNNYWEPLESVLSNYNSVFLSPDGIYNSISVPALKHDTNYIIDEKEIAVVNNLKFITTRNKVNSAVRSKNVVLIGNPQYGNPELLTQLPGTEKEVLEINQLFVDNNYKSQKIVGELATEEAIKQISHPDILHIATHGFFMQDVSTASNSRAVSMRISNANKHPLLRSGIMLAGSALQLDQEVEFSRKDDGILTAYEAMNLDLEGTELVVLSACETGLGEIVSGEGVYGLSRSLKVAGSNIVIISLWKVDDAATQLLMTTFYQNWLTSGDITAAFISAQQLVRDTYPAPYYWAPFVMLY